MSVLGHNLFMRFVLEWPFRIFVYTIFIGE